MKNNSTSTSTTGAHASAVVKEHFTISNFNREYDLLKFIQQVSKVRKLQKKFYSCQDKTLKRTLLIECKREESALDALGNALWLKYQLGSMTRTAR